MEFKEGDWVEYIGDSYSDYYIKGNRYQVVFHENFLSHHINGLGIYNGKNFISASTFKLPWYDTFEQFKKINNIEIKEEKDYYKWLANR